MASNQKFITLSSGFQCPVLGLGTYKSIDDDVVSTAIKCAIKAGYRHIDTAYVYKNELAIGNALKECFDEGIVKREDMFITTKLFGTHHRRDKVSELLRKQLKLLQLDYIDLYLIHSPLSLKFHDENAFPKDENGNLIFDPEATIEETWQGMQDSVKQGLARSIGVSNFNESQLERVLQCGSIKPSMMQVEVHPFFQNTKLINYCKLHNVAVTGFYPLGSLKVNLLHDERLIKMGEKYGKTAAQVCLRWQVQRGLVVIPKSENPGRIVENVNIWDFELSQEDMAEIAKMDTNVRAFKADFPGAHLHPEFPFTEQISNRI